MLGSISAPEWLIVLLANGVGGGLQVVATFIPIVGFLFLFLLDPGGFGLHCPRAFVMDRVPARDRSCPASPFVPLIVGFGCTVPAVMGDPHAGARARTAPP